MQNLKITIIQTHLHWQDSNANLQHFDEKINAIIEDTDVIILPEMFTTGFTMNPQQHAESHQGNGLQWMQKKAKQKKCTIIGSIAVKESDKYYNRLYSVNADGTYQTYNKRHLFKMANEHQHYSAGAEKIIINVKGWKICPLICYDLRFPVWSRNTKTNTYDVLIYVANWPEVRNFYWKQLLIARAIENQSYVVGVNRIGADGNDFNHSGDSVILSPKGEVLSTTKANDDKVETISLSYTDLIDFRKLFPVLIDGDEFEIL